MKDEEFEKYFTLLLKCFIEYDYGQRLTAYPKVRKILEEIENNAFSEGMDDVMKNIEMFTPKEAKL